MICSQKKMVTLAGLYILIACLAVQPSLASDPPDSKLNPVSGFIETADSVWEDDNHNVRHVINFGKAERPCAQMVSLDQLDDHGARLAITDDGDSFVIWWRDGEVDRVMLRVRDYADGAWGTEKLVSESEKLMMVAGEGDKAATAAQAMAMGGACKGCHDQFRLDDKK